MSRLQRCRELLERVGVDFILVSDAIDVRYFSGFRGGDAMLVVGTDDAVICTDSRYWEQVREEVVGLELFKTTGGDLAAESTAAVLARAGGPATLGFQGTALDYASYRTLRRRHQGRLRDVGALVAGVRAVKEPGEVSAMRRAAAVTELGLAVVVAGGLEGRREADVAWDLVCEYHRLGADGEAFPAIVAAGDHAAQGHAIPGERVIAGGELVVIDTGARVDGYCSDITRTFAVGEPGEEVRRLYDIVLAAQLAGLAEVRAGAHGRDDVDAAARRVIAAAGYGAAFGHGTGHGVGLGVHEAPNLGRTRGELLRAGMVCTVEPGIYLEGSVGIRIEDTVLVTDGGCERLTVSSKELTVVD